jgi:purine-binding chemotaxis protein CheW
MGSVVIFEVAEQRFALPLASVEQALRIVEITPLANAPSVVAGVIDVRGVIIPVIDMRCRFGLPRRPAQISDQLLIANSSARKLALCVDAVGEVVEYRTEDFTAAAAVVPGMESLQGIAKLADGLVFIHDLERLLSLEEANALAEVIGDA